MNFQTLNKQRKFVLIASILGVISLFLPWISVSLFGYSQSVNGFHDKGIIVFICFLISGGVAIFGEQTKNLDKTSWAITLLAGVVALLLTIWFYSQGSNSIMGSSLVGFGVYIAAIAAIGVIGSAYLLKSPEDNFKDSFSSLKKDIESKLGNNAAPTTNTTTLPPEPPVSSLEDENIKPVL